MLLKMSSFGQSSAVLLPFLLAVLILLTAVLGQQQAATVCTVDELIADSCTYIGDGVCDANGSLCALGSDCFDCDPCQAFAASGCDACIAAGCLYCEVPALGLAACSSPSIAAAVPDVCVNTGTITGTGTPYQSTCDNSSSPASTSSSSCDISTETCPTFLNGDCDADGIVCPKNSDCFDCDPCLAFRYDGCDACVAAGCVWCGLDTVCLTLGARYPSLLFACAATDFNITCPAPSTGNFFQVPFYDAQSWLYDLINVKAVWESGISKSMIFLM